MYCILCKLIYRSRNTVRSYLLPRVIVDWFGARGIKYPSYCGNNSSGTGYTDGVSNRVFVYMVHGIHPHDEIIFKLEFPDIKLYISEQVHDWGRYI